MIIELFSGARGAGIGIGRALPGARPVGIEIERDPCATSAAVGMSVIRADVANYPTTPFVGAEGLWASPPCQAFSRAGQRVGVGHFPAVLDWIATWKPGDPAWTGDPLVWLVTEPLRWALECRPGWIVCEQVPDVLPIWRSIGRRLGANGYSWWAGDLCSANFGTPQTRIRAFLLASRLRHIEPPVPTHAQYPTAPLFGGTMQPWVSLADALGWDDDLAWEWDRLDGSTRAVSAARPAHTVCGHRSPPWGYREGGGARLLTGRNTMKHSRRVEDMVPFEVPLARPAPTVMAADGSRWHRTRPATTVASTDRVAKPGHRDREGGERQFVGAIKMTLRELAVLQDFPSDWPFVGNKTSVASQIGNAVPSRLAEACVRAVTNA